MDIAELASHIDRSVLRPDARQADEAIRGTASVKATGGIRFFEDAVA